MARITTHDHRKLYVREIGRGPVVVLVHGFGMDSLHWLPLVLPLAHRYRFVLPDLRGFGRSSRLSCSEDCVASSHARDLHAVIQHYGQDGAVGLGGISLGATTALRYMELFGADAVRHYLHIDQAPRVSHGPDWSWGLFGEEGPEHIRRWQPTLEFFTNADRNSRFEDFPAPERERFYDHLGSFLSKALSRRWMKWGARRLSRVPAIAHQLVPVDNWYTLFQHLRAYAERDYDFRPLLPTLQVPTTIITGRRSEMYPWQGQAKMHELLPDSRLVMFEDSGHMPILDQPVRFIRELNRAFGEGA
ncbi:MAG: alpha/beta hydrolase [Marinobacter sp.]|uniref:alpha/beta fold hydrolase n=1 Tax=Marinobacter sp. TaxID=50741 RepID=UPI00299D8025|nr:alpha/beta hydrolase [Marinobacter sp.]MDX1756408.1 alpha/beta hydrolase [Marinobacter sp.]